MKKSIILLLISLFVFCINLNNKQTIVKKQNDTSITAASDIDRSSVLNIEDVEMTLDNSYYSYLSDTSYSNDLSSSSVKTSYHFLNNLNDRDLYISNFHSTVINNVITKVQTMCLAKTLGLLYKSQYFNIYLFHSTGKLGRT